MRRSVLGWLFVFLPLALGLAAAFSLRHGVLHNRVFVGYYVFDLAWLVSVAGISSSVIVLGIAGTCQLIMRKLAGVRVEAQTSEASRRREFIRRLDHEVKTLLSIILTAVENVSNSPAITQTESDSLDRARQQAQRLGRLIVRLRGLTELEGQRLEPTFLELHDVFREVIDSSISAQEKRKIELQIQEVPRPVVICADRDLLVAALRNLLDNAIKFTREDGLIQIRAFDDGRTAAMEIADNGMGIAADEIEHVFEELYRGKNAKTLPGSGLGLALTQKIALLHGGTIRLRSIEGHGTVVAIRLPLALHE